MRKTLSDHSSKCPKHTLWSVKLLSSCHAYVPFPSLLSFPLSLSLSLSCMQAESQSLLTENSAPVYLKKVESHLREEAERARHFLDPSTESRIVRVSASPTLPTLSGGHDLENFDWSWWCCCAGGGRRVNQASHGHNCAGNNYMFATTTTCTWTQFFFCSTKFLNKCTAICKMENFCKMVCLKFWRLFVTFLTVLGP